MDHTRKVSLLLLALLLACGGSGGMDGPAPTGKGNPSAGDGAGMAGAAAPATGGDAPQWQREAARVGDPWVCECEAVYRDGPYVMNRYAPESVNATGAEDALDGATEEYCGRITDTDECMCWGCHPD